MSKRYRAVKTFTMDFRTPSGMPAKKTYERGQLVKIPDNYVEDPEFLDVQNSARRTTIVATAFKHSYAEEVYQESGEMALEEQTRHILLPVQETNLKAGEDEEED